MGDLYGETIDINSPFFARLTADEAIFAQALTMRLSTKRGFYWADPEYGLLLSDYVNEGLTPDALARLPLEVQLELEKDERVGSAAVKPSLTTGPQGAAVELLITVTPVEGKVFAFVVAADAVTVDLITVGST